MTDVVRTAPTTAPIQTPPALAAQTPATVNTPAASGDNKETNEASPFMAALAKQIQVLNGDAAAVAAPALVAEVATPAADDSAAPADTAKLDAAPLTGQNLPLDGSFLPTASPAATPPPTAETAVKTDDERLNDLVKLMQSQADATPDSTSAAVLTGEVSPALVSEAKPIRASAKSALTAAPTTDQAMPVDFSQLGVVANTLAPISNAVTALASGADQGSAANTPSANANSKAAPALAPVTGAPTRIAAGVVDTLLSASAQPAPLLLSTADASASMSSAAAVSTPAQAFAPLLATGSNVVSNPVTTLANAVPMITVPLAQAGWDQALSQRVQWMVGQQMQGAELRITPPHLGPMEVRISMGPEQQTTINFTSPHAVVRDAIEAALPRLRDMLGDTGLNQVNVNVSQHSFAEQRRQALPQGAGRDVPYAHSVESVTAEGMSGSGAVGRMGNGLVDYFA